MKTVIEMAREADLYLDGENLQQPLWVLSDKELERFATLVRADEREACAKLLQDASKTGKLISCLSAAAAIRARGRNT